ncbi:MAG TPA: AMIN domain-containing protein, partial [Terriglobales bacterium]
RLVIDLPNASMSVKHKKIDVNSEEIKSIRLSQYQADPPVVRVVVDLAKPHSYTWDTAGNRLMVRLHLAGKEVTATPPSLPVLTKTPQPVALPVNSTNAGTPIWADKLSSGASMSTSSDTTTLRLTRGGEVHVCPGTTVSIAHSANGPDLLLGMGTGAVETHYALENSADSIVTPDFRFLLRGPGEFHYAIAADAHGNTCVRPLPGNTASLIVSELMGDRVFKVQGGEQYVFHGGRLNPTDTEPNSGRLVNADFAFPQGCGCPTRSTPPTLLASLPPTPVIPQPNSSAIRLAQPGDEIKPLVPRPGGIPSPGPRTPQTATVRDSHSKDVHIQVEARVVYPAPNQSAVHSAPLAKANSLRAVDSDRAGAPPTVVLPPYLSDEEAEAQPQKPRRGVFGKIKGFFGKMFR